MFYLGKCDFKDSVPNPTSDLTKQYYKTTNSMAQDEMFNSMYNKQIGFFQGDGTKKTFYNGSQ